MNCSSLAQPFQLVQLLQAFKVENRKKWPFAFLVRKLLRLQTHWDFANWLLTQKLIQGVKSFLTYAFVMRAQYQKIRIVFSRYIWNWFNLVGKQWDIYHLEMPLNLYIHILLYSKYKTVAWILNLDCSNLAHHNSRLEYLSYYHTNHHLSKQEEHCREAHKQL